MWIARAVCLAALLAFAAPAAAQTYAREETAAAELRAICEADRGRLWGVSLCGPLMAADPATRRVWASQADAEGVLQPAGRGWVGALPDGVGIANYSVEWAGVRWIMVLSPLPENRSDLRVLLAHEAWHRAQDGLGLPAQPSNCAHLASERGRYLMRLELRALSVALRSRGAARRRAVAEALAFRAVRHREFPGAAAEESALDRNEGLAAYTGVVLGAGENAAEYAARTLDQHDAHSAYARAYAYATGPAYGLLLDERNSGWRGVLYGYAPADLLATMVAPANVSGTRLQRMANRYGGPVLAGEERERAQAQAARVAELRSRFAEGPRLELPLAQMQFEFDPNQVTPVDELGSVYQTLVIRDAWGELRAGEGALISADWTRVTAAAPAADGLSGPGWRLTLSPGYRLGWPDAEGVIRPEAAPESPETPPPPGE